LKKYPGYDIIAILLENEIQDRQVVGPLIWRE